MKNPLLSILLLLGLLISCADAEVYRLKPTDDWFAVLHGNALRPGDEVILQAGVYRDRRLFVMGHQGSAEKPIVIRAADGAKVVFHRPDARQNTINIVGGQYLTFKDLEITGGESGIRMRKSGADMCKFITLEGLHIHHIGGVAVTANNAGNTYEGLVFRRNHIHHTGGNGEGFYLGANNNADGSTAGVMFNSLIEGNYIHDLNGPKVNQGDGIEIKDGSYNNVVRDNVIHDTQYPGITIYGTDGKAPNVVERNVIWNTGDHGIQAAAECVIRNNIVFAAGGDGVHCRNHQSARVGSLKIVHNTLIAGKGKWASGVRVSLGEGAKLSGPVLVANNALYAESNGFALRVPRVVGKVLVVAGNVGSGAVDGLPKGVDSAVWNPAGRLDHDLDKHRFPLPGSALIGKANARFMVEDDFNGTSRGSSRDAGAYMFRALGNPGWKIVPGFKAR